MARDLPGAVRNTRRVGNNAEFVREVFRDLNRSGIDGVLDLMHPQIEVVDLPHAPEERRRRGPKAVAAWFHSMEDVWATLGVDAEEVTELDPDRVLAVVRFSGHAIRDGKVVRCQIYPSRNDAIAEASAAPQA